MCDQFTLHHKFRIDTGRTKFGQGKTDVILYGCESHEQETQRSVRDCFTAPRLAVDTQFVQRKEFKFYQTKSNAIIFHDTLSAYCIPRVVVMESGEIIHENVKMSPRFPPQISLKDNWVKELDSEVAGSSKGSQQIQPK